MSGARTKAPQLGRNLTIVFTMLESDHRDDFTPRLIECAKREALDAYEARESVEAFSHAKTDEIARITSQVAALREALLELLQAESEDLHEGSIATASNLAAVVNKARAALAKETK